MAFQASGIGTAGTADAGQRRADETFCHNCGNVISREAAICVNCGVATRRAVAYGSGAAGLVGSKSKTTSVLLAIFFSYWTWLYTYREDSTKFWATLAIHIVNGVLTVFTLGLWLFVWVPVSIGTWIWSIVDVTSKTDDWYLNY